MRASITLASILSLVLIAACSPGAPDPGTPDPGASEPTTEEDTALADTDPIGGEAIEPVPHPELDELEERVQQQLRGARASLDEKIESVEPLPPADLAAAYGELGMLYQAYMLREASATCYRNAIRLGGPSYDWYYLLGRSYEGAGDLARASAALERALQSREGDPPAMIRMAQMELRLNRFDRAERAYRHALELNPQSAAALLGLGKIANGRRQFEQAREYLEQARSLAPEATEINYPLGLAYRGLGDNDRALELFESRGEVPAPVADPLMSRIISLTEGMRIHQIYGAFHYEEGRYESALAEFEQAVAEAPDEALVRTNLAVTLLRLGRTDEAREQFEEALRLDSGDAFTHYNYGTMLADQGDDATAVEHFRATVEIDPRQYRAHLNLANALRRLGRHERALPHYRSVIENDPNNGQARLAEALTLVRLERYAEARWKLHESHEALPDDPAIRQALVRVLAAAPDPKVRDGRYAMQLSRSLMMPEMPLDRVVALAMVAAENGMWNDAVQLQSQAIQSMQAAGRDDLIPDLQEDLTRYRSRRPCRTPWKATDPLLNPKR